MGDELWFSLSWNEDFILFTPGAGLFYIVWHGRQWKTVCVWMINTVCCMQFYIFLLLKYSQEYVTTTCNVTATRCVQWISIWLLLHVGTWLPKNDVISVTIQVKSFPVTMFRKKDLEKLSLCASCCSFTGRKNVQCLRCIKNKIKDKLIKWKTQLVL